MNGADIVQLAPSPPVRRRISEITPTCDRDRLTRN